MLSDAFGQPVSTERLETIEAIDTFVAEAFRYGTEFGVILDAVEAEPDCVMARSLAAVLMMFMESGDSPRMAQPHLDQARRHLARASAREQSFCIATQAWVNGEVDKALAHLEEHMAAWPEDAFAMKVAYYHYFNLGRAAEMLAAAEAVLPAHPDNGYVHSMRAFALEQSHRLEEAEEAARHAMDLNRADPWAHHALAHVMETQGRIEEGAAFMDSVAETWAVCNSFMLTHNWWHLALFHLDMEHHELVLGLYDDHVWGVDKSYSQDQIGAVALLWRMELRGIDVGDRWSDLAAHIAGREGEHLLPFLDLHYLYALSRAGQAAQAQTLIDGMAAHAERLAPAQAADWSEVALPAAKGARAHALGHPVWAARFLGDVLPRLHRIGGSHAQRDLFHQAWIDCLIRAGQDENAISALLARTTVRDTAPFPYRQLALLYQRAGQAGHAATAAARAEALAASYA